jgi:hypothetical protein
MCKTNGKGAWNPEEKQAQQVSMSVYCFPLFYYYFISSMSQTQNETKVGK